MARLAQRVADRRLLVVVSRLLRAKVVLPDGVVIGVDEGVPPGSPLSPLLSNVVLDELDRELARCGHRFVRYADDANVYVRSERAGLWVMASLERFIEGRLCLKINPDKSAVARPEERHFLGFCLRRDPQSGAVVVLLSQRTRRNAMARIRELTPRQWGGTLESCIHRVNVWLRGWHQFFGIAAASEEFMLRALDAHIRRRLRVIVLKHWRRQRTIARNLVALGVKPQSARRGVYAGRKSVWALSHSPAVDKAMPTVFFTARGLLRLVDLHRGSRRDNIAPLQPQLGWSGDRSRSLTGRRRGSQPAVPRSRVRTAQARFCGSRGGQPPRLPEYARHDQRLGGESPLWRLMAPTTSRGQLRRREAGWEGSRRRNRDPRNTWRAVR